jgi:hypothetical protein
MWSLIIILILLGVHILYALLLYRGGQQRFNDAVGQSMKAMKKDFEFRLEDEIRKQTLGIQQNLRYTTASPKVREKLGHGHQKTSSMWDTVKNYVEELNAAVDFLQSQKKPGVPTPYRSLMDMLQTKPSFEYKEGKFTLSQETEDFITKGLHKGWKEMNSSDIAKRIKELTKPGFEYIENITAEHLLLNYLDADKLRDLYQTLLDDSSPLLVLDPTLQGDVVQQKYICVEDEKTSTIAKRLGVPASHRISTGDPFGFYVLQTLLHIRPEQILSLQKEKTEKKGG